MNSSTVIPRNDSWSVASNTVTVEAVGDQGDGIAKVDRGYVVIVPEAKPGEQPRVRIEDVQQNVAFASIVDSDPRTL